MQPALENAQKLYRVFQTNSTEREGFLVWRGYVAAVGDSLNLSKSQREKAVKVLKDSGCIEISRTGNRYEWSELILDHPPTDEDLTAARLTSAAQPAMLEQQVNNLTRLIGGVDIARELAALNARVTELEQKQKSKENTK